MGQNATRLTAYVMTTLLVATFAPGSGVRGDADSLSVSQAWWMDDVAENIAGMTPSTGSTFWSTDSTDDQIRKHSLNDPTNVLETIHADSYEGLAWDGSNFWATNSGNLVKLSASGSEVQQFEPACTDPGIPSNGFGDIQYKDGFLWIMRGETPSQLMKVSPGTGTCAAGWTISGLNNGHGLAWDDDRNSWWVLRESTNVLYEVDGADPSAIKNTYTVSNMDNSHWALLYMNGNLYAAGGNHEGDDALVRITPPAIPEYTPPSVGLSADAPNGPAPWLVSFTATATEGTNPITSWTLSYGDGEQETGNGPLNGAQYSHQYAGEGSYTATLTTTDGDETRSSSVSITVSAPDDAGNNAASAKTVQLGQTLNMELSNGDPTDWFKLTVSQGTGFTVQAIPATSFELDMTVTDPDGGVARQQRTAPDGEAFEEPGAEDGGTYYIEVYGRDGAQGDYTLQVISLEGQHAPVASLSSSISSCQAPCEVTFDLSASDTDDDITSWKLDFDDGAPLEGSGFPPSTRTHTFSTTGTYYVVLTVWDAAGLDSVDTYRILVSDVDQPTQGGGDQEDGSATESSGAREGDRVLDAPEVVAFFIGQYPMHSLEDYLTEKAVETAGKTVIEKAFEVFFGKKAPTGGLLLDLVAETGGGLSPHPGARILTMADGSVEGLGCERFSCWVPAERFDVGQPVPLLLVLDLNSHDPARLESFTITVRNPAGVVTNRVIETDGLPPEQYGLYLFLLREALRPSDVGVYEVTASTAYVHPNPRLPSPLVGEVAQVGFHVEEPPELTIISRLEKSDGEWKSHVELDKGELEVQVKAAGSGIEIAFDGNPAQGRTLNFVIDLQSIGLNSGSRIEVEFDGARVLRASGYADIMNPNDDDSVEYYEIIGQNEVYLFVSVPSFSPHVIHVSALDSSADDRAGVPAPGSALILLCVVGMMGALRRKRR